jgi:hypothetical protein
MVTEMKAETERLKSLSERIDAVEALDRGLGKLERKVELLDSKDALGFRELSLQCIAIVERLESLEKRAKVPAAHEWWKELDGIANRFNDQEERLRTLEGEDVAHKPPEGGCK